jgi:SAM-dependent methyltransferase
MDPYIETIVRFFLPLPREGPGDDRYTEHLYRLLNLPENPRAIDMGAGSGAATLILARLGVSVTAVDMVPEFLAHLRTRVVQEGLDDRVRTLETSMDAVPETEGPFDLIWSEGAVYNIGFDAGIRIWRRLLAPGGYIVVSEMTWLVDNPPIEVRTYWESQYSGMRTVSENEAAIASAGYQWMGSLLLPAGAWEDFYEPQRSRVMEWKARAMTPDEANLIEEVEEEMRIFEMYHSVYGYVFYLMRLTA